MYNRWNHVKFVENLNFLMIQFWKCMNHFELCVRGTQQRTLLKFWNSIRNKSTTRCFTEIWWKYWSEKVTSDWFAFCIPGALAFYDLFKLDSERWKLRHLMIFSHANWTPSILIKWAGTWWPNVQHGVQICSFTLQDHQILGQVSRNPKSLLQIIQLNHLGANWDLI